MTNRQLIISTAVDTITAARRAGMFHNQVNNSVILKHLDSARSTHTKLRPYWRSLTSKQQWAIVSAVYKRIP